MALVNASIWSPHNKENNIEQLDSAAHEKLALDEVAATSTLSTTAGTEEDVEDGATSTAGQATEGKATTEAGPSRQTTSKETAIEDSATTEAGPAELASSIAAGTEEISNPNVQGEATTQASPTEVTSSTRAGTDQAFDQEERSLASTPSTMVTDTTTKQAEMSEVADCAEVAPSTFPGGCDLDVSKFACYAVKNLVTDMQNGRMELQVHWACSTDEDQGGFTTGSCRALNWTHAATAFGGKVVFRATPGIYSGLCEFRTRESPILTNTEIAATTSLSALDGNDDSTAPDQTAKATTSPSTPAGVNEDVPSEKTTGAPGKKDTNTSSAGTVPNSTNSTRSGGSRPRGTVMYVSTCLWFCASLGILRPVR